MPTVSVFIFFFTTMYRPALQENIAIFPQVFALHFSTVSLAHSMSFSFWGLRLPLFFPFCWSKIHSARRLVHTDYLATFLVMFGISTIRNSSTRISKQSGSLHSNIFTDIVAWHIHSTPPPSVMLPPGDTQMGSNKLIPTKHHARFFIIQYGSNLDRC